MNPGAGAVFLFDVDNTLLDNDRLREDLRERLQAAHGARASERYWEIMEELWGG
jgi:FMN phosphatase YigB (HAD superfamily)